MMKRYRNIYIFIYTCTYIGVFRLEVHLKSFSSVPNDKITITVRYHLSMPPRTCLKHTCPTAQHSPRTAMDEADCCSFSWSYDV